MTTRSDRLQWAKFGEARKNTVCWSVVEDVEIDITHPELKARRRITDDSGTYIILAEQMRWLPTDVLRLKESDPDSVKDIFFQVFKRRLDADEMELQSKFRPSIAAIETAYAESMAKIQADLAAANEKSKQEYEDAMDKINKQYPIATELKLKLKQKAMASTVTIKDTVSIKEEVLPSAVATVQEQAGGNLGIRGRFNAKLAERKKHEDAAPVKSENSGVGLSARLKQMKQEKQDNEQESTLFVSNISEHSDENDIRQALNEKFNVRRVNLVRKASSGQKHAGVGFVVLVSPSEAERCMEFLNGYRMNHMVLSASFSSQRN